MPGGISMEDVVHKRDHSPNGDQENNTPPLAGSYPEGRFKGLEIKPLISRGTGGRELDFEREAGRRAYTRDG